MLTVNGSSPAVQAERWGKAEVDRLGPPNLPAWSLPRAADPLATHFRWAHPNVEVVGFRQPTAEPHS
jgi:hypothetical protein